MYVYRNREYLICLLAYGETIFGVDNEQEFEYNRGLGGGETVELGYNLVVLGWGG